MKDTIVTIIFIIYLIPAIIYSIPLILLATWADKTEEDKYKKGGNQK